MRAAYAALVLGVVGGLGLATAVLSDATHPPMTVAEALAADPPAGVDLDRRRADAVAALVAACMDRLGLRWTPVAEPPPGIPDAALGPVDWAQRWGFGVSTMVGRTAASLPADPNLAGLESASPARRDAYRRALLGDERHPGCRSTATESVFGLRDRLLAPLRPALEALDARIAGDAAALRALAAWRSCVSAFATGLAVDRGTLPGALVERFLRRTAAIGPGLGAVAGLAALQVDERRAATAIARCEVAFAADRAAAAAPYEAAFVAEHREALITIGAAIRAAEGALPTRPP